MGKAQIGQHLGTHAVLPGIDWEALTEVGVHGVEALVLEPVGPQLVADADTPPLMAPQVDNHPDPLGPDLGQCGIQL